MVQIKNITTAEVLNFSGASKKHCTKNSVIIDRLVTISFRKDWPMFVFFESYTSGTLCTLKEGYEVIL